MVDHLLAIDVEAYSVISAGLEGVATAHRDADQPTPAHSKVVVTTIAGKDGAIAIVDGFAFIDSRAVDQAAAGRQAFKADTGVGVAVVLVAVQPRGEAGAPVGGGLVGRVVGPDWRARHAQARVTQMAQGAGRDRFGHAIGAGPGELGHGAIAPLVVLEHHRDQLAGAVARAWGVVARAGLIFPLVDHQLAIDAEAGTVIAGGAKSVGAGGWNRDRAAPADREVVGETQAGERTAGAPSVCFIDPIEIQVRAAGAEAGQIPCTEVITEHLTYQARLQASAAVAGGVQQVGALTAATLVGHGPAGAVGNGGGVEVGVGCGGTRNQADIGTVVVQGDQAVQRLPALGAGTHDLR